MVKTQNKTSKTTKKVQKTKPVMAKRTVKSTRTVKTVVETPVAGRSRTYRNPFYAYAAFWRRGFTDWCGASSRSEYWWSVLFNVLIGLGAVIAAFCLLYIAEARHSEQIAYIGVGCLTFVTLFGLASLIPQVSITMRRLRDAGFSPWWTLLYFVAMLSDSVWNHIGGVVIGLGAGLALMILMLFPTKVTDNSDK